MLLLTATLFSIAQTPYAHYPLDGNANDVSGNNLNGTLNGSPTPTLNRYNQTDKALDFDGSGDYVALPVEFDFATMTVVVWFKATSLNGVTVVYSCDNSNLQHGQQKVVLNPNQGNNTLSLRSGSAAWDQPITLNQWHQVAIVRTPALVKFYVDGTMVSSVNNPTNIKSAGNVNYATVGASYQLSSFFTGNIDDLKIYTSALTEAELTSGFNAVKNEKALQDELLAYCTNGIIHTVLKGDALNEVQIAEVYDCNGRLIARTENLSTGSQLNQQPLTAGIYVIAFLNKKTGIAATRKVVVN